MRGKKTPPSKSKNAQEKLETGEDFSRAQENTHYSPRRKLTRRGQARKPYQEKLLDMAEARREIVMALKLHRASMKQAREKTETHQSSAEQEAILKSRRNPRIYASSYYVNYLPGLYSSPYYSRPAAPPLFIEENPNFVLPSQTLGLKLNLQNFNNLLDTSFYSSANSSSIYNPSSSPPSTSCSRSVGDDRRMTGWGDGISAGRAEFLGIGPDQELVSEDLAPFDEVMEFPAWVNADESCVGGADYFLDPALPCMDIEEIEGMDEDWLA